MDEKYFLSSELVERILSKSLENIGDRSLPAVVNPAYRKPGGVVVPKDVHKIGCITQKYPCFSSGFGERPCFLQNGIIAKRSGGVKKTKKCQALSASYGKGVSGRGERTQILCEYNSQSNEDNPPQPQNDDACKLSKKSGRTNE